jgi:hypothetical protein
MKKHLVALLALAAFLSLPVLSFAQSRTAGQMVVPLGWENRDSIRFSIWGPFEYYPWMDHIALSNSIDSLSANSIGEFGTVPFTQVPLGIRKNGAITSYTNTPLDDLQSVKQRIYYAEPSNDKVLNGWLVYDVGYFWRYIDSSGAYHNNEYDANDISPYMEFPASSDSVKRTFGTYRYGTFRTPCFGNEGKTVLGYSDNRLANQLLSTYSNYPYGTRTVGGSRIPDTARNLPQRSNSISIPLRSLRIVLADCLRIVFLW